MFGRAKCLNRREMYLPWYTIRRELLQFGGLTATSRMVTLWSMADMQTITAVLASVAPMENDTISMNIGTTIRGYRLQKGMSQGDIEKKTGLLRCYLSRVENGHTVPSLETLQKIGRSRPRSPTLRVLCRGGCRQGDVRPQPQRGRDTLSHPGAAVLRPPQRRRPQAAAGHGSQVRTDIAELAPRG